MNEVIKIVDNYITELTTDIRLTRDEIRRNNTRLDVFEQQVGKLKTMRTRILEEMETD
jgi:hypothetical protein